MAIRAYHVTLPDLRTYDFEREGALVKARKAELLATGVAMVELHHVGRIALLAIMARHALQLLEEPSNRVAPEPAALHVVALVLSVIVTVVLPVASTAHGLT